MPGLLQPHPNQSDRKNLIPMLIKTFHIGTIKATGLLNCVVRDTAIDINANKLNCEEDRRIRWTTYQNLGLWFDSWEAFLIDYGFATISQTRELIIEETMKKRILNLDETCLSLDGGNGNRGSFKRQHRRPKLRRSGSKPFGTCSTSRVCLGINRSSPSQSHLA